METVRRKGWGFQPTWQKVALLQGPQSCSQPHGHSRIGADMVSVSYWVQFPTTPPKKRRTGADQNSNTSLGAAQGQMASMVHVGLEFHPQHQKTKRKNTSYGQCCFPAQWPGIRARAGWAQHKHQPSHPRSPGATQQRGCQASIQAPGSPSTAAQGQFPVLSTGIQLKAPGWAILGTQAGPVTAVSRCPMSRCPKASCGPR